jgi:hypothetical protein
MLKLTTLKGAKKTLASATLAIALAIFAGFHGTDASAQGRSHTWSVAVHIEYIDGSVYEHVVVSGLPTEEMPNVLYECNSSHAYGSAVRFHCFPIPE